jgi:cytoskeleton protein RodZ
MSEEHLMSDLATSVEKNPEDAEWNLKSQALSAGQMLRAAREASGLHIAALAVSMKVPVKKLEALEADRFDLLPHAVFVRALAASVCRTLKIDAMPILERLPQGEAPRLESEARSINTPFHVSGQTATWTVPTLMTNPVVVIVGLLLIGVLLLVFFPESARTKDNVSEVPSAVTAVPATEGVSTPLTSPVQAVSSPAEAPIKDAPLIAASAALVPMVTSSKSVFSGAMVEGSGQTLGMVIFKVRGPSWVEVTDAKGVVQVRKTLVSGETLAASGDLPLSVVVGRVDVTDVEVRGKPFNMTGLVKDNVARFEVK